MFDKKRYAREYYMKNKKRILKDRKARYENDPDYRDKLLKKALVRKKTDKKNRTTGRLFTEVGGVFYYRVGWIAKVINRSPVTVRDYCKTGVIPPFGRDSNGWRIYTEKQVAVIEDAFILFDSGKIGSLEEVPKHINTKLKWGK